MLAWSKSGDGNISFIAQNRQFFVTKDHKNYNAVLDGLRNEIDENDLVDLVTVIPKVQRYIADYSNCGIEVNGDNVYYVEHNGDKEALHGTLVKRLLDFIENDLPLKPIVNFIHKLMQNPSSSSVNELFDFLENEGLPLCEDGDFLAYKAIRANWTDKRTGSKDNSVGNVVREKRNKVDDNRDNTCSTGLHAGAIGYVNSFGSFTKDMNGKRTEYSDRCIIVKINPANVVSVPKDYNCQKLRTCEYLVLAEYENDEHLNYHLARNDGSEWESDEDDYDDYDYYYEDGYDNEEDWY